jgi:hypothetical protein
MAKSKRGQLGIPFDDERLSKLFGMFLLFLSFYFLIAFTSYFFTWENDHDIVFRFSWEIFLGDVEVDNWLGRLGAFLADSIIYWGFGWRRSGLFTCCTNTAWPGAPRAAEPYYPQRCSALSSGW